MNELDPDIATRARNGDSFAQLELGKTLYHTTCINNNCNDAFKWLSLSAKQENMEAQFMLGDLYALGHGVDQNILSAHEWYTKSSLQGYEKALIRVHNLYEEDRKIHCRGELNSEEEGMNERDFKKKNNVRELYEYRLETMQSKKMLGGTIEYFSKQFKTLKESNTEDKDTYYKLGFHYQYGYGIRKITKRAIECYTKAAEQGHVNAQYHLGFLYQHHTDIKFNYRLAFEWYTLAAEGGNSSAQNCLAYFYEKGLGTDIDLPRAIQWYTRAFTSDNTSAKLNAAKMYRKGDIVAQDYMKSIRFYVEAAKKGNQPAINCILLLNQIMNIAEFDPNASIDLYSNISSVKKRLHSRLRFDVSNLSASVNIIQLKKLAKHALIGDGNAMFQLGKRYFNGSDFSQDKNIGFRWMHNAAKAGFIEAQLTVGKMYEDGEGDVLKQDYYKASVWYFITAKQKNHIALYKVGLMYYRGHGVRKDPLEASKWFIWSANRGNSDAQYMLGVLRLKGEGLSEDKFDSFQWFTKSAIQKNPRALYQLGKIHWTGENFGKNNIILTDKKRAIHFYTYAAQNGSMDAQMLLAKMYEDGNTYLKKDLTQAFTYYYLATKLGHSGAEYKIGCMYLYGTGVEKDNIKAFELIAEAAEKGHYEAQCLFETPIVYSDTISDYSAILEMFRSVTENEIADMEYNIGYAHEFGLTHSNLLIFDVNVPEALKWYGQAGKKSHPSAFYRLGLMYEEGRGVTKSLATAFTYYSKGAELKNPDSLNRLANMYLFGTGAAKDPLQAFELFFEAANFGHFGARKDLALLYSFENNSDAEFAYPDIIDMIQKAALSGNVYAQYKLGLYYESCYSKVSAMEWYKLASQAKVTEACYRLGRIYEEEGSCHDYLKAIGLYQTAIEKKNDKALYQMARMYQYGKGVPRDYFKAFKLYGEASKEGNGKALNIMNLARKPVRKNVTSSVSTTSNLSPEDFKNSLEMYEYVAENGNTEVQYQVGYIYEKVVDPPEFEKAKHWYTISASNFHEKATYRLGKLYADGNGVSQNWIVATEYFDKAMQLGSSSACFELGLIYHQGLGMMADQSKGVNYFRQAADLGNSKAQYKLGQLYEKGEIGKIDLLEALRWYSKAYTQENNEAITRLDTLHNNDNGYENWFNNRLFHSLQEFANRHNGKRSNEDPDFYGYMYFQLAYMHFNGITTKVDYKSAWKYFTVACHEYNMKEALCFITEEDFSKSDSYMLLYRKKLEMFREMIDSIDRELLYDIGLMFYNGKNVIGGDDSSDCFVPPDYFSAFTIFIKLSDRTDLEVQRFLGDMYYYGNGVQADHKEATTYHCTWATQQDGDKNFQTGCMYYEVESNIKENRMIAFIYLSKASNQRNEDSEKYLQDKYYSSQNALEYMKKALEIHECFATLQNTDDNIASGIFYCTISLIQTCLPDSKPVAQAVIEPPYQQMPLAPNQSMPQAVIEPPYQQMLLVPNQSMPQAVIEPLYQQISRAPNQLMPVQNFVSASQGLSEFLQTHALKINSISDNVINDDPLIASIYFHKAASQGNPHAFLYLEHIYCFGEYQNDDQLCKLDLEQDPDIISVVLFHLETAAKKGNTLAQRFLGSMYYYGDCIKCDKKKAIELYNMNANNSNSEENGRLGLEYLEGSKYLKKNPEIASVFLEKAVEQGNYDAQIYLGDIYYYGYGVDKNQEKAFRLHKSYASQLNRDKSFDIGCRYHRGDENFQQNYSVAAIYFERAVEKGHRKSYRLLAETYYYGNGVDKNQKKACEIHKAYSRLLNSDESYSVGFHYHKGIGSFEKNPIVAAIYFNTSSELGNHESYRNLGDIYYYGEGVAINFEKAYELHNFYANQLDRNQSYKIGIDYYKGTLDFKKNLAVCAIYLRRSAELGNNESHRLLGDFYYNGDGVEQDKKKAIYMYEYSANQLNREENFKIGHCYYEGYENFQRNQLAAKVYFENAAKQGSTEAKEYLQHIFIWGYFFPWLKKKY